MRDSGRKSGIVDSGEGTRLFVLLGLLMPSQWTVSKIYVFDGIDVYDLSVWLVRQW
jgi:hypothetical protein